MKPYYDEGGITIYHGDCRESTEWLTADVLVTDPPYGIGYSSGWACDTIWSEVYGDTRRHRTHGKADGSIESDIDTAIRDAALAAWGATRPALVFGSLRAPQPAGWRQALVWDKGGGAGMGDLSIPWKPNWELIYVLGWEWKGTARHSGVIRQNNIPRVSMGRRHPHEKPAGLLRQLLSACPGVLVADPFMGAGSTLRAAKDLGRRAVGVEIEERYCEIAARRLGQEVLDFGAGK